MILESREVTKKYGGKTAVNQVSLQLEQGLVYAMLGRTEAARPPG